MILKPPGPEDVAPGASRVKWGSTIAEPVGGFRQERLGSDFPYDLI